MEIVAAALLSALIAELFEANHRLRRRLAFERRERARWAGLAARYAHERADYERALGLPLWDEEVRDRDLWSRAVQGDPVAGEVVIARQLRALGVRSEPELFMG